MAALAAAAAPLGACVAARQKHGVAAPATVWSRAGRLAAVLGACCPGVSGRRLLAAWPRVLASAQGSLSVRPGAEVLVLAVVRAAMSATGMGGGGGSSLGAGAMQELREWALEWAERRGAGALEAALPVCTRGSCPATVWLRATELVLEGTYGALPGGDVPGWLRRAGPGAAAASERRGATEEDQSAAAEVWLMGYEWLVSGGEAARAAKWHAEGERTLVGAAKSRFLEEFALRRAAE